MAKGLAIPMNAPSWLPAREFRAWLAAQLKGLGLDAARVTQPHRRPWSIVWQVELRDGRTLFAKASAPELAHEAALTAAIAHWSPRLAPQVLALERARGWLLLTDAGISLRARATVPEYWRHWRRLLPQFAREQRLWQARTDELLALGLPDRRLHRLPALFRELLDNRAALCMGEAGGLSEGEWRRLRAGQARFAEDCAQLQECGIAASLHHDDFHDGNVFINAERGGYTIADWGESALAPPFFSLRVTLRHLSHRFGLCADAPELRALVDEYLAVWGDVSRLRPVLRLARRLASVQRALTWAQLAPRSAEREDRLAAAGWLRAHLSGED